MKTLVEAGETDNPGVDLGGGRSIKKAGLAPDYVSIRRQSDLAPPVAGDTRLVVLGAVRIEATRLIDNVKISIT